MERRLAVLLLLGVAGCAGARGGGAAELAGSSWRVETIAGHAPAAPATLSFGADGRLAGSTGCNRLIGGWALTGERLGLSGLATTRRACPPPLGDQETELLSLLNAAATARLVGERLVIEGAAGTIELARDGG